MSDQAVPIEFSSWLVPSPSETARLTRSWDLGTNQYSEIELRFHAGNFDVSYAWRTSNLRSVIHTEFNFETSEVTLKVDALLPGSFMNASVPISTPFYSLLGYNSRGWTTLEIGQFVRPS